ncbi:hypothetical protein H4R35_006274, partial [Dimargaris xerosporica]
HRLPKDLEYILNDNEELQLLNWASAEETDDADVSMDENDTKVEMDMDVDGSVNAENYRLEKAFESYTLFIKNAIKSLRDLDDKSIDVEGYMGMKAIPPQTDWLESRSITLLLVYWNTRNDSFDFHVTKLPYSEIFGIDYKAICINGMRPALVSAFGTSIFDSSALEQLAKPKVASIDAHLDEGSKPELSDLGTKIKTYQGDNLAETYTQDANFDPHQYVFPIPPRPEVSKYSHEKDGFYLVYWDLELNEFKYKMATQDEITAYKDGNSVKLFDLMKSVCVIGRHYPANIPWEEFAKYMKAYFQWIEEKSPAGWKERLMRLRDAWKAKQGVYHASN